MKIIDMGLDRHLKETIIFQDKMLHYSMYNADLNNELRWEIPWHWHDEFEFGYVISGRVVYRTGQKEMVLCGGDGIFINKGVLHCLQSADRDGMTRFKSQFFDRAFLAGASGSIIDLRYIAPVQEQRSLDAVVIRGSQTENAGVLNLIQDAIRLSGEKPEFFEMRLRNIFSQVWERVYQWAVFACSDKENGENMSRDRQVKQMLVYIQENYHTKLTVGHIAAAAHVSERECYRLFQTVIGMSPMDFVISCRLQAAAELLACTDHSVLDIAMETGFGTSSYFGKIFRKYYQTAPLQYRKMSMDR